MCAIRKQVLNAIAALAAVGTPVSAAFAAEPAGSVGGIALGDSEGGITDRAFVVAPPDYQYIVERDSGSFINCGEGMDVRVTDGDGRDLAPLRCGVTLTETVVIPTASESARLIVHF